MFRGGDREKEDHVLDYIRAMSSSPVVLRLSLTSTANVAVQKNSLLAIEAFPLSWCSTDFAL